MPVSDKFETIQLLPTISDASAVTEVRVWLSSEQTGQAKLGLAHGWK